MVAILAKIRSTDLPYTIVLHEVSEDMFDELVDEDTVGGPVPRKRLRLRLRFL